MLSEKCWKCGKRANFWNAALCDNGDSFGWCPEHWSEYARAEWGRPIGDRLRDQLLAYKQKEQYGRKANRR